MWCIIKNMKFKETESDILRAVCEYLSHTGLLFWRQNNVAVYDPVGGRFKSLPRFARRGLPDIFVVMEGRLISETP